MKKLNQVSPLHVLLFLFVFVTSCNGQNNTNKNSQSETASSFNEPLQLGFATGAIKKPDENPFKLNNEDQIAQYIKDIHQDKWGNFWFATQSKGAVIKMTDAIIYFGKKEGIADNQVNGISIARGGVVWFATANGVSSYGGGEFVNYSTNDGLSSNKVQAILADSKGTIWAATQKGVCKFNGESFVPFEIPKPNIENPTYKLSLDNVWKIMEDSKGNIWFARDGYGAAKFDGKQFTHYTKKEGLRGNDVMTITEDSHGNMWFGTIATRVPTKENEFHYVDSKDGGVTMYDGKTFKQFPEVEGLTENDIYPIYSDKKGNVWIGSKLYGVFKYDGQKMELYKETGGLTNNCAQSVFEDKDGELWLGFSGGLFKMKDNKIVNEPLSNYLYYDEPYRMKIRLEKGEVHGENIEYTLTVEMILDSGAFFVSPKSKGSYNGFFDISIKDNDHLEVDNDIVEIPESKATIDPFTNGLVYNITENTIYKKTMILKSKGDFEVQGLVRFVIEPQCTLEELLFVIIHEDGELRVKKLFFDGC